MTRCLSAMRLHLQHAQSLNLQCLLCPLSQEMTPWLRHRAHFGLLAPLSSASAASNSVEAASGSPADADVSADCPKTRPVSMALASPVPPPTSMTCESARFDPRLSAPTYAGRVSESDLGDVSPFALCSPGTDGRESAERKAGGGARAVPPPPESTVLAPPSLRRSLSIGRRVGDERKALAKQCRHEGRCDTLRRSQYR